MSKLTSSIIAGLIIGILLLFLGNYIVKHYLYSYVIPRAVLESQTKPKLSLVNTLLPQSLEITQKGTYYEISWKTVRPVKSVLAFTKTTDDFSVYSNKLTDSNQVLVVWVDKQPTIIHKVTIPTTIKFKTFYILEIQGAWAVPYGQKIFKDKGASTPYSLLNNQ